MISVVYCTRNPNRSHYDHIRKTSGLSSKIEVIEIVNKGESLTKAYNRGLEQATNDIVVFCHDDIVFTKNGWGRKLVKHFNTSDYGILGIAGTTDLAANGQWWSDQHKMVGIVKHSDKGKTWESKYSGNFGNKIIETLLVDGLFFAVHKERIQTNFNEDVEGFHFYEVDFCFRNHLAKVKIGVVFDVKVTHKSIGQTNKEWDKNRQQFIQTFANSLPRKLEVNPEYKFETKKMSKQPRLKIFLSTNGDKDKIKKSLKQIEGCGYENLSVSIVVSEDSENDISEFENNKVSVHEGVYPTIHKNLSVLRWDTDFVNEDDELLMFLSDDVTFKTNIINKFVSVYNKDKNFGGIFPRVTNSDNTILACGIMVTIIADEKNNMRIKYALKGMHSYYGYTEGLCKEPLGNVGFCFMTTNKLLTELGWFRLDFDRLFYEAEFATKCSLVGKNVYIDNDSVVQLPDVYLKDETNLEVLNKDANVFINAMKEIPESIKFMRKVMIPSTLQQQQQS